MLIDIVILVRSVHFFHEFLWHDHHNPTVVIKGTLSTNKLSLFHNRYLTSLRHKTYAGCFTAVKLSTGLSESLSLLSYFCVSKISYIAFVEHE